MNAVPCDLCGLDTLMVATRLCDRCWEVKRIVEANPDLARKVLATLAPKRTPV